MVEFYDFGTPEGHQRLDSEADVIEAVRAYVELHGEDAALRDLSVVLAGGPEPISTGQRLDVSQFLAD